MPTPPQIANDDTATRRASARRTALIVGGLALAVYVGFILMTVMSK
jgi:hypothetical protein